MMGPRRVRRVRFRSFFGGGSGGLAGAALGEVDELGAAFCLFAAVGAAMVLADKPLGAATGFGAGIAFSEGVAGDFSAETTALRFSASASDGESTRLLRSFRLSEDGGSFCEGSFDFGCRSLDSASLVTGGSDSLGMDDVATDAVTAGSAERSVTLE